MSDGLIAAAVGCFFAGFVFVALSMYLKTETIMSSALRFGLILGGIVLIAISIILFLLFLFFILRR